MIRYRFKTNSVSDPRPIVDMAPIKMPWWCTGYSYYDPFDDFEPSEEKNLTITTHESAIIVCYLPEEESLYKYWDDAFNVEAENVDEIKYSDRFPKPEWCE